MCAYSFHSSYDCTNNACLDLWVVIRVIMNVSVSVVIPFGNQIVIFPPLVMGTPSSTYLATSSPIASFPPSPPSVGLSTNHIVGIAVGLVVAVIIVTLLTITIVFCM